MNRTVLALALVMALPALAMAQPDPNARPMAVNPPEAVGAPPGAVGVPGLSPDTPENAIRYFIQQLSQNSELGLSTMVAGVPVGYFGSDEWASAFRQGYPANAIFGRSIDVVNVVTRTENTATVEVTMHIQTQDANGQVIRGEPQKETLQLRRETVTAAPMLGPVITFWRVVPPPIEDVLAKPLDRTPPLALAAAFVTHDPRLLPLVGTDGGDAQTRALNQLKQLGLGALQFVQDYNEVYAFDDVASVRAIEPYTKSKSLFIIPGTKGEKWHFNDNLSTLSLAKINEVAKTVLFYDGQAPNSDHLNFRFDGKTAICFADGHAAALSKDEARGLVWKP